MPGLSGTGWIAGMVRPLRLKDLCCSEEQRPVEHMYYCLSMTVLSVKAKAGAEVVKTDFVWVQITLRKHSCSYAAVMQGCVWILMIVSWYAEQGIAIITNFNFINGGKIATNISSTLDALPVPSLKRQQTNHSYCCVWPRLDRQWDIAEQCGRR